MPSVFLDESDVRRRSPVLGSSHRVPMAFLQETRGKHYKNRQTKTRLTEVARFNILAPVE